jgi:lipopolysaccharide/colanic/teichoic acid biosynthesis glycosyltransferase
MKVVFKRVIDIVTSLIALLLLSPVLIVLFIVIRLFLGKPVLFQQQRLGLNGKVFRLYKFRSMTDEVDENGNLLPDKDRLTKLGQFIRSASLDELPSFINVLKGEMSLVGPRPLLPEYLPLYSAEQAKRHKVKPGITGLAQVNGRNAISWETKFEFDVWYVENISLSLDLKILILTIKKVLVREGISAEGFQTMPKFDGNKDER